MPSPRISPSLSPPSSLVSDLPSSFSTALPSCATINIAPPQRRCIHRDHSIRDESMRAYDAGSIPGMRRPRSDDARVIRWVSDAKIDRLIKHISIRPIAGNTAANALKRQLLCAPVGIEDTLNTLDALMRRLPYFYRYLATARFFNALWNAYKNRYVNADAKAKVLILIKAWAEDLHRIHLQMGTNSIISDDPAAVFWIEKYHKKRKYTIFPKLPSGAQRPYLCPDTLNTNLNALDNGNNLARNVNHLDNLLNIAGEDRNACWKNNINNAYERVIATGAQDSSAGENISNDDSSTVSTFLPSHHHRHSMGNMDSIPTQGATLLLPKRAGRANPKAAKAAVEASRFTAFNDKVLAVLRRYDETFARNRNVKIITNDRNTNGADRPPNNNTSNINNNSDSGSTDHYNGAHFRRRSTADIPVTVAAKARTEARWKLSMSGSGFSTSTNNTNSNGTGKKVSNVEEPFSKNMEPFSIDSAMSFPALTPATFPSCPFDPPQSNDPAKPISKRSSSQEISAQV